MIAWKCPNCGALLREAPYWKRDEQICPHCGLDADGDGEELDIDDLISVGDDDVKFYAVDPEGDVYKNEKGMLRLFDTYLTAVDWITDNVSEPQDDDASYPDIVMTIYYYDGSEEDIELDDVSNDLVNTWWEKAHD